MKKKLIFIDLDGTMCQNRQQVNELLVGLVNKLAGRLTICIVSGAVYDQLKWQINGIKNVWVSSESGCILYDKHGNKVYKKGLTKKEKEDVKNILASNNLPIDGYLRDKGCQLTYYCLGEDCPYENRKDFDPKGNLRTLIVKGLGSDYMIPFNVKIGGTHAIDFTPQNVGKRYVVEYLRNMLGFQKEECLYIGDKCYPTGNDWIGDDHEHYLVKDPTDTEKKIMELLND